MDDLSFVVQSIIDTELDDLLLDLVYDLHSSLKGIPEDQLELNPNGSTKARQISSFNSPSSSSIAIEKHTCACPRCGQGNIVAIRFAYHLAKCLGVGRRSSRQAKNRIVDQVLTITASSDDSRSNGDDCQNGDLLNPSLPEDAGSCTDSTSSSSNNHRRLNQEDQDYRGDFDEDEEEEEDWTPKKKKRRPATTNNPNPTQSNQNKTRKRTKKEEILRLSQPTSQALNDLDFHNCIIPLDKLCPRTQHVVIPLTSSSTPTSSIDEILLKSRHVSSTVSTRSSSPTVNCSSHYFVRSPLNLVEDDQSSTTSIIRFKEDNKR